ncbi:hypothetical protein J2Y55_002890 [Bosea sp. BE125]|uniref:hypothetical protein n=1 Tax=Bosea sp. BE125 TaxID=2817909 RepID=UPI00285B80AB|nr:hypothetical protein [Bosea sp. BE125]
MITLHSFGPGFGLPDPSPFCIKAEILLRMAGLPFERETGTMRILLSLIVERRIQMSDGITP